MAPNYQSQLIIVPTVVSTYSKKLNPNWVVEKRLS